MYLKVDKAEVGQHEGGNGKRGELCQSDAPVPVCPPPHLPPHSPNPPFKVSE